jgi:2-amino-4-hydroxy-6-hydroxymethyldihydropteridine diphosphokinase
VETALSPRALLERTRGIEQQLGRDRANETRWGPRPIDIDILAFGDVEMQDPDLQLPHPRMFERAFVLVPLAEIAGDRVIGGIKVADALARIDAKGVEKLPPQLYRLI